jgi:Flp pilus assembly protein TadD
MKQLLAASGILLSTVFALTACSSAPQQQGNPAVNQELDQAANPNPQGADSNGELDQGAPAQAPQEAQPMHAIQAPSGSSNELYNRFNNSRSRKDWQGTFDAAGEILARNPNDTKVLNALACLAIDQDKDDMGRLLLNKVLALEPNNSAALNNLGVIELKADNLRMALIDFKKATETDPRTRAAHANLGTIYLQYRNYLNASAELESAVENGDQSPATLNNLGFAKAGAGDFGKARSAYEKAMSKDPGNIPMMLNYAALLVDHTGDKSEAIKLLNKIRFIAHEPAILNKVEVLLRKAEGVGNKSGNSGNTKEGDLE